MGGGSRKNKRSTPPAPPSAPAPTKKLSDLATPNFPQSASQDPKIHQGQDLNLAYPPAEDYSTVSKFIEVPYSTELDKGTTGLHHDLIASKAPPFLHTTTKRILFYEYLLNVVNILHNSKYYKLMIQ